MVGERKPGVGGEPLAGQDLRPKNSVYPRGKSNISTLKQFFDLNCILKIEKARVLISLLGLLLTNKCYALMPIFKSQSLKDQASNIE